jgi:hypothetical protein
LFNFTTSNDFFISTPIESPKLIIYKIWSTLMAHRAVDPPSLFS